MIVGVGVDVLDIERFARLVSERGDRFTHRWFTSLERAQCDACRRPATAYATRFAVKEAVWKALGVPSWSMPIAWRSIEVLTTSTGLPLSVALHGPAADVGTRAGAGSVHATVSVAGRIATAIATAVGSGG